MFRVVEDAEEVERGGDFGGVEVAGGEVGVDGDAALGQCAGEDHGLVFHGAKEDRDVAVFERAGVFAFGLDGAFFGDQRRDAVGDHAGFGVDGGEIFGGDLAGSVSAASDFSATSLLSKSSSGCCLTRRCSS